VLLFPLAILLFIVNPMILNVVGLAGSALVVTLEIIRVRRHRGIAKEA